MTKIVIAFHSPAHFEAGDAELDILASMLSSGRRAGSTNRWCTKRRSLSRSARRKSRPFFRASSRSRSMVVRACRRCGREGDRRGPRRSDHQGAHRRRTQAAPKTSIAFDFVDRLQSIAERARLLTSYWAEKGDPGYVRKDLARYDSATAEGVLDAAKSTSRATAASSCAWSRCRRKRDRGSQSSSSQTLGYASR